MNYYVLIATIISLFAVIGHFAIGAKAYVKPVTDSGLDPIPKNVVRSLFHYMSVFMIISAWAMAEFAIGLDILFGKNQGIIELFGYCYGGFALAQFIIAAASVIKNGVFKLFQWVFWALISVFCFLGI